MEGVTVPACRISAHPDLSLLAQRRGSFFAKLSRSGSGAASSRRIVDDLKAVINPSAPKSSLHLAPVPTLARSGPA
jgi:hypothetical protein